MWYIYPLGDDSKEVNVNKQIKKEGNSDNMDGPWGHHAKLK